MAPEPAAQPVSEPASIWPTGDGAEHWRVTRSLIASDYRRLREHLVHTGTWMGALHACLLPNFQALLWFRVARCLLLRGWAAPARLITLFNLYLTRAELVPTTSIGPSALMISAHMVHLFGRIGARVTLRGYCGMGGGFGVDNIGAGPGYPWIGDDVDLGYGSMVLGPVRIGDGVRIGVDCMVVRDVPPGGVVPSAPSKTVRLAHQALPAGEVD